MRISKERRALSSIAGMAALGVLLTTGPVNPAAAETINLTMVGAWSPGVSADADIGIHFMEEVNKRAGGDLVITFKGASEVVPTFDQPEALVRGIFDIWYGAPNYWAGVVPAGYITELSPYDIPDKGPGSELFEFMVQMYEAEGVRYLGHFSGNVETGSHFLITQEKVSSIEDLKGMKVRVPPLNRYFVEAVGAEPVTLPPGEIYIALERGTVEGLTWPYFDGFTNFGWQEVAKYLVSEPLYRDGLGINMNLEAWNSLSEDMQNLIMGAVRDTQMWAMGWVAAYQNTQLDEMTQAGMQVIELPPEESERWSKIAEDALWAHFKTVMSAEDYAQARSLTGYE